MSGFSKKLFIYFTTYSCLVLGISAQSNAEIADDVQIVPGSVPVETWSVQTEDGVDYQCVQKCYPLMRPEPPPPLPVMPQIVMPTLPPLPPPTPPPTPPPPPKVKLNRTAVAVVEKQTHVIDFTPGVLTVGYFSKQCCYIDRCIVVSINDDCPTVCYEPCDAICTGECLENPACPGKCEQVALLHLQYEQQYKMWLAVKLNEIQLKYRQVYEECVQRTSHAFRAELSELQASAQSQLQLVHHFVDTKVEEENELTQITNNDNNSVEEDVYQDYPIEGSGVTDYEEGVAGTLGRRSAKNFGIEINIEGQKNYGPSSSGKVNQNIGINNRRKDEEGEADDGTNDEEILESTTIAT